MTNKTHIKRYEQSVKDINYQRRLQLFNIEVKCNKIDFNNYCQLYEIVNNSIINNEIDKEMEDIKIVRVRDDYDVLLVLALNNELCKGFRDYYGEDIYSLITMQAMKDTITNISQYSVFTKGFKMRLPIVDINGGYIETPLFDIYYDKEPIQDIINRFNISYKPYFVSIENNDCYIEFMSDRLFNKYMKIGT